jgi:hypothetical protein
LPSIYARPGHRVQEPLLCEQVEQTGKSFTVIDHTSFICGECFQMSMNLVVRTLPVASFERLLRDQEWRYPSPGPPFECRKGHCRPAP